MPEVTLYSKNQCYQCKATARQFEKLGIPFTERNMDTDPDALAYIIDKGYREAPIVELSNGESWTGFRLHKIRQLAEGC